MKSSKLIVALIALVSLCVCTEGLQCYQCFYLHGVDPGLIDEELRPFFGQSCEDGFVPEDKFAVTCESQVPGQESTCAKVFLRTELSGVRYVATIRACMPADAGIDEGCKTVTVEELSQLRGIPEELVELIKIMPDSYIKLCSCNENKCVEEGEGGSGPPIGGGDDGDDENSGNSGTMLKIADLVLVISSFILVASKMM